MAENNSTVSRRGAPPRKDYSGLRFGKRLVLSRIATGDSRAMWRFRCDCGYVGACLTQGLTRMGSCLMCGHKGPRPHRRKRPFEATYNIFVGRAKYPVSITYEQFAELAKVKECHYCGAGIVWQEYRNHGDGGTGSNLDRMDSAKPYDIDNVVVCCGRCNYAKNAHFTYDEWKQIGALIRSWGAGLVAARD